jgi:protein-arginine deiminase
MGRTFMALALVASACSDEILVSLQVTPAEGIAPLRVRYEATATLDGASQAFRYRFDFDGGAYDTELEGGSAEFELQQPGTYEARVEAVLDDASAVAKTVIVVRANQPPTGELVVDRAAGRIPLTVQLECRGCTDPDGEPEPLQGRYDFEGDGIFDTEVAALGPASHTYSVVGAYSPVLEVRDFRGGATSLSGPKVAVQPGVDIDVDADRDGLVGDLDDPIEDIFAVSGGAVFLANVDDDDGDGTQDWRDTVVSGMEDLRDLAPVMIPPYPGLPADSTVTLSVSPVQHTRVFAEDATGRVVEILPFGRAEATISAADVAERGLRLFLEGAHPRQIGWDGRIDLSLTVARSDDGTTESDTVAMRVAPVIFPDNTRPAEILYVMPITIPDLGPNMEFYRGIQANTPPEVQIYDVDQIRYLGDRWVQDNMQTGYQVVPASDGLHVLHTFLETVRPTADQGLEYLVTEEILGDDHGYVYSGGSETSLNYGGNIEITPPFTAGGTEYSFGRTLVGGGSGGTLMGRSYEDHMTREQRFLLDAQVQGPTIELTSEWLLVGHLDEIIQFVPNPSRSNGKDFMLVISSPELALASLEEMDLAGLGSTPIFEGRREETSVGAILADARLVSYNEAAQARIDTVREKLVAEMGLTGADIVEVPVLYEPIIYFGEDYAVAYNPGIQNLVTLRETLLVPDPEGPDQDGVDRWQAMTREVLEPLGLEVHFLDVFESYHVNYGEAHCGTEVRHTPYEAMWWEKE